MATFAVVGTGQTYTTVDGAIDNPEISIYVKAGSSIGGWSQDQAGVEVELGPGCTVTSDINITGANNSLIIGSGCDIQAQIDVTTGVEAFIEGHNGVNIDGIDINTALCYVNGGGWGTISDGGTSIAAYDSDSADNIIENIALKTTTGSTGEAACDISNTAAHRNILRLIKIIDSEEDGISLIDGADSCLLIGNTIIDADAVGILNNAVQTRILGNNMLAAITGDNLESGATGDNSIISGNVVDGVLELIANGDSQIVVGNRIDTTLTDGSTNSTVAANDLTGF